MKVFIDDVEYVPLAEPANDNTVMNALEVRFDSDAGDNITVRDYLRILLETLWRQGEGFNGKRPFGNGGWEYEIYTPLVAAGFIPGKIDSEGCIETFDQKFAEQYGFELIAAVFNGVSDDTGSAK